LSRLQKYVRESVLLSSTASDPHLDGFDTDTWGRVAFFKLTWFEGSGGSFAGAIEYVCSLIDLMRLTAPLPIDPWDPAKSHLVQDSLMGHGPYHALLRSHHMLTSV